MKNEEENVNIFGFTPGMMIICEDRELESIADVVMKYDVETPPWHVNTMGGIYVFPVTIRETPKYIMVKIEMSGKDYLVMNKDSAETYTMFKNDINTIVSTGKMRSTIKNPTGRARKYMFSLMHGTRQDDGMMPDLTEIL